MKNLKKLIAPSLGLLAVLGLFAFDAHSLVLAQGGGVNNGLIRVEDNPQNIQEATTFGGSFRQALTTIVNFFLFFLGIIATIMVIYGGFLYITSGGDDTEKAKKVLMYAAIGIIVVLIAFALVNTLLGSGDAGGTGAN